MQQSNFRNDKVFLSCMSNSKAKDKTTHFWFILKQQLISCQEVFFRKQLHVLTNVLHIVYGIDLTKQRSVSVVKAQYELIWRCSSKMALELWYLLLIVKLICFNLLDLFIYSASKNKQIRGRSLSLLSRGKFKMTQNWVSHRWRNTTDPKMTEGIDI